MQFNDYDSPSGRLCPAVMRFSAAVRAMEQTVLVPSLLRDVPLGHGVGGDMYEAYAILKGVHGQMESGGTNGLLLLLGGGSTGNNSAQMQRKPLVGLNGVHGPAKTSESWDAKVLESEFCHHVQGLQRVLSAMSETALVLTTRYKEEVACTGGS